MKAKLYLLYGMFLGMGLLLQGQPLALHPENPHYFLYKGKPTVLVTSAEHYGAVLNLDFDYPTYLKALSEAGMNYTRIFTGSYVEVPGSFGIEQNTLSPAIGRFIAPWQRTKEPSLTEGESKFDLDTFNPDYFKRLNDFLTLAGQYGIMVEITFFCATYSDSSWNRHPFNPENNINDLGTLKRQDVNTLVNKKLSDYQLALVKKIVESCNAFDHIFYELSNEPWADNGVKVLRMLKTLRPKFENMDWALWSESAAPKTLAWQNLITETIVATEAELPKKHLIAQNFNNFKYAITHVHNEVDIINFHYAWPEAVALNYGWNRPISFDESGFAGQADTTYLDQAWAFMLAGGAVFNNLDYSFAVGHEEGNSKNNAPGGGSASLRNQLRFLHDFLHSIDFIHMGPDHGVVVFAPGLTWQALSKPGHSYAIYFSGQAQEEVKLDLPKGTYHYEWLAPENGMTLSKGMVSANDRGTVLKLPNRNYRLALRIEKE